MQVRVNHIDCTSRLSLDNSQSDALRVAKCGTVRKRWTVGTAGNDDESSASSG